MTVTAHHSAITGNAKAPQQYNIILLGETQSGKSTLVEGFRRYADPTCEINEDLIGDGLSSHTKDVRRTTITTNLPNYCVEHSRAGEDGVMRACQVQDEYLNPAVNLREYERNINHREGLSVHPCASDNPSYIFHLYDTPGLNDTESQDEFHVVKIFNALTAARDIHLVILTVTMDRAFTPEFQNALKCYFDMVPEFLDNLVFVHTHIDYKRLHPADREFEERMSTKRSTLQDFDRGHSFTHFNIDCDLRSKRPVRRCLTQNTLKRVLEMAQFNQPLTMKKVSLVKTPRMKNADALVKSKYEGMVNTLEMTLAYKNAEESALLKSVGDLEVTINHVLLDILRKQDRLAVVDTGEPEVIYDHRFDEHRIQGKDPVYRVGFEEQDCRIIEIRRNQVNITGLVETGGEGSRSWQAEFQAQSVGHFVFHVRVYATKREKNGGEIKELRAGTAEKKVRWEKLKEERDILRKRYVEKQKEIQELSDVHEWCLRILRRASEESINAEIFLVMVQADAYKGSHWENSLRVSDFYVEMTRRSKGVEDIPKFLTPSQPMADFALPDIHDSHMKRIILVGKKNAGVSSVADMLVQGDLFKFNRSEDAGYLEMIDGREWSVLDAQELLGKLGDKTLEIKPTTANLRAILEHARNGFLHFSYVVNRNDLSKEPSALFESFKELFQGAESNFVVIVTHCEDEDWVVGHEKDLSSRFGNIVVIGCDFPLDKADPSRHQEARQRGLQKLESRLAVLKRSPSSLSLSESRLWSQANLSSLDPLGMRPLKPSSDKSRAYPSPEPEKSDSKLVGRSPHSDDAVRSFSVKSQEKNDPELASGSKSPKPPLSYSFVAKTPTPAAVQAPKPRPIVNSTASAQVLKAVSRQSLDEGERLLNLYIRGLELDMDNLKLYEICRPFGPLRSWRTICTEDGVCTGVGFVMYKSNENALRAMEGLQDLGYDAEEALPSATDKLYDKIKSEALFLRNVPLHITDHKILCGFFQTQDIMDCAIPTDRTTGFRKGKGYAFLTMRNVAAAERFIEEFNGFQGKDWKYPLEVSFNTRS